MKYIIITFKINSIQNFLILIVSSQAVPNYVKFLCYKVGYGFGVEGHRKIKKPFLFFQDAKYSNFKSLNTLDLKMLL